MNAEIISVGSELLLGQIVNTNARFLSEQLAALGVDVYYHTVVGDNPTRLLNAVRIAEKRADCLIFTGGLGPTNDDLTKESLADYLGVPLVPDLTAKKAIAAYFAKTGRVMTGNNIKQSLVLANAKVLPNEHGMAPGMILHADNGKIYLLLPGPPVEMEPMFQKFAVPNLQIFMTEEHILSRIMRFYGIGESELETRLLDLIEAQSNPTIAPLAFDGEVTLRLTAKQTEVEEANRLLDALSEKVLERVGAYFYGYGNVDLVEVLVDKLKEKTLTISAAESLTGGLFQQSITAIPGASEIFTGGMVTYASWSKSAVLGVEESIIKESGVVSEACAREMAIAVRNQFRTDIGLSFTGVAGPDSIEGHPVGTVFIGYAFNNGQSFVETHHFGYGREGNRIRSVKAASHFLIKFLSK